jgi:3'(2'), 5'-bisphosphate nucleotidase
MTEIDIEKLVRNLIDTFLSAGEISINLRKNGLKKKIKSDNTPVTNGDLEVNKIISKKLNELTPSIPIISEEKSDNKLMQDLKDFWLVDPIDGTNDYINDLDEFTINAGLILDKKPAAGIIYAPAKKRMFYSFGKDNAYELTNGKEIKIDGSRNFNKDKIKFVSYSDKIKPEIQKIFDKLNVKEHTRMKSSLKFCVIATGEFDGYVAEPRACEWDIAAGHAILKHSGGSVTDFTNNEILYGKKNFKNPSLILKSRKLI